jgi:hypothetical protein
MTRPRPKRRYTQHDHALIRAKREKRPIILVLAVQTPYTDEEGTCQCRVEYVDELAVEIVTNKGRKHWVNKAFIVSTGDPE